ncbi:arylesterase [Thermomonas sp.]|uniref:arylesterase n=1 Tax=Thermomonas sp. TaxID=1971895 RepID=UPI0024890412|nr:arylesterase [Thermomonas sp.]MDI1253540.1 arylesterase [Thermomonas sp.]
MSMRYGGGRAILQWAMLFSLWLAAGIACAQPVSKPQAGNHTVLVVGDSLSAAYGIAAHEGWVALTGQRLAARKPAWHIVNASISGDTSAGGAARIVAEVVRVKPAVVVIELGANDGLRGLPLRDLRRNLARMVGASQSIGAKVLVIGMRLPPNYGQAYTQEFERGFCGIADLMHAACLPFLLEPIARDRTAFQDDNLHPVASAQPALRDHVWPALAPLLD